MVVDPPPSRRPGLFEPIAVDGVVLMHAFGRGGDDLVAALGAENGDVSSRIRPVPAGSRLIFNWLDHPCSMTGDP